MTLGSRPARTETGEIRYAKLSRSSEFDLIVLDLVLPRMTGQEILTRLRAAGSSVPVIMLTANDAIPDRVALLNAGADDYLTKPCSFSELLARIRARLRTAEQTASTELSHGRVTIDSGTREVRIGGRSVELTPREFALLETLMRNAGQVLSQTQLLDQVWGYDRDPTSNVVEVYVGYLRKKLRRGRRGDRSQRRLSLPRLTPSQMPSGLLERGSDRA